MAIKRNNNIAILTEIWTTRIQQDRGGRQGEEATDVQNKTVEKIRSLACKEKEEKELAWSLLEILYLCSANTWVRIEEEDAEKGGGDQSGRQGGLADQDHRDRWANPRANLGEQ